MNKVALAPSTHQGSPLTYTLADTHLAQSGFVTDDERAAMARVTVTPRSLAAGNELIRAGSSPDNLYLLSTGWAYRSITTPTGGRQIPALLVPGDVCNLDNLLFERADFGVRMITDATVLMLPRAQALALSAQYPGVGRAFTLLALAENAILTQWAVGLGRRSAQGRLAHLLCEMSIRIGTSDAGVVVFDLPLTQELMGDMLGLTNVHVNRIMQSLRLEGIISTADRTVTILDLDRLRSLGQFDPSYLHQIAKGATSAPAEAVQSGEMAAHRVFARSADEMTVPGGQRVSITQRTPMRDGDLLLRETHHRCSNDLQLIISLLELQSRRAASEETRQALAETVERVSILARSRNSLNRERQPSLEAALRQVCEALQAHAEPRAILISTHVECEVHGLSATQTTTLALVVNELATNAIKHAFGDGMGGHIQISIRANAGRDLTIVVTDNGDAFQNAPAAPESGLGLGLTKRLMASIGGLLIPPLPGSKTFELRLPIDSG